MLADHLHFTPNGRATDKLELKARTFAGGGSVPRPDALDGAVSPRRPNSSGGSLRSLTGQWLPQPLALGVEEDEVMFEMPLITFDHSPQGDDAGAVVSALPRELGVG
jgi:hypothetical protein